MATISLKGNTIHTVGNLPAVGSRAPGFTLVNGSLGRVGLDSFAGKSVVFNIFPSMDTGICAMSVRRFSAEAGKLKGAVVVNVSADLPFAHNRFCTSEGISNVQSLSTLQSSFGQDWGVQITDGPMAGLMSRAIVVIDGEGVVRYTEQVPEIVQEPDYDAALAAL